MKFTKTYVPDKRWHDNLRPVRVNGNTIIWIIWKLVSFTRNILDNINIIIEKSFKEIDDSIERIDDGKKEQ